jgi:hypothetical protein
MYELRKKAFKALYRMTDAPQELADYIVREDHTLAGVPTLGAFQFVAQGVCPHNDRYALRHVCIDAKNVVATNGKILLLTPASGLPCGLYTPEMMPADEPHAEYVNYPLGIPGAFAGLELFDLDRMCETGELHKMEYVTLSELVIQLDPRLLRKALAMGGVMYFSYNDDTSAVQLSNGTQRAVIMPIRPSAE